MLKDIGHKSVDQMLPGGFYLGQVMEIQAPVRPLCLAVSGCCYDKKVFYLFLTLLQFVSETMKAFLEGFAKSKIHYIDTIGSFEPEILKRIASQVQKPDESVSYLTYLFSMYSFDTFAYYRLKMF